MTGELPDERRARIRKPISVTQFLPLIRVITTHRSQVKNFQLKLVRKGDLADERQKRRWLWVETTENIEWPGKNEEGDEWPQKHKCLTLAIDVGLLRSV